VSDVSQKATLTVIVADFAMADTDGKVNVIGAGISGIGFDPHAGLTNRFSVVTVVDVPSAMAPAEASIELALLRDNEPVLLPGPAGPQALRIGQVHTFEKVQMPVPLALREHLQSRYQAVIDFNAGLPLAPGAAYTWALQVDGDTENGVIYPIVVAGGPTPPVIG
jgi:hypothetical protein